MDICEEVSKRVASSGMIKRQGEIEAGKKQALLDARWKKVCLVDTKDMIQKRSTSPVIDFKTELTVRIDGLRNELLLEIAKTKAMEEKKDYKYPNFPCWTAGSHAKVEEDMIRIKYLAWDVCSGCDHVVKICLAFLYPAELLGMMHRCEDELETYEFLIK